MTFEEFWKNESGWYSANEYEYEWEGSSEYNLAKEAFQAGKDSAKTSSKVYDGITVDIRNYNGYCETLAEVINRNCTDGWALNTVLHKRDSLYLLILEKIMT